MTMPWLHREKTLVDRAYEEAGGTYAIGKIADIFAHRGITKQYKATGLSALFDATLEALEDAGDRSLILRILLILILRMGTVVTQKGTGKD